MRKGIASGVLIILATTASAQQGGPWLERLELSLLDGTYGFALRGVTDDDEAGAAVAIVGDVNGDGVDDLAVGVPGLADNAGAVFVVYGRVRGAPFPPAIELRAITAAEGFRLDGEVRNDALGRNVAAAGDVNDDGLADFLVGAAGARAGAGDAYIVFGTREVPAVQRTISDLGEGEASRLRGRVFERVGDQAGAGLAGAGDFNGDSVDDLAVGAPGGDIVFLLYGGSEPWPVAIDLRDVVVARGTVIAVTPGQWFGGSLSMGDVNGDGLADLLIGAPNASPGTRDDAGSAYLLYGTPTPGAQVVLPIIDPAVSSRFDGLAEDSRTGRAVAILGDVDDDGNADVAVYRPRTSDRSDARIFVRFGGGGPAPFLAVVPLWGTHQAIGFDVMLGTGASPFGSPVTSGDVDGDGVADLIVGVADRRYPGDPVFGGRVYVFFGGHPRPAEVVPHDTREGVAYMVGPTAEGYAGRSVNAGGDINGDGITDLVIGAPGQSRDVEGAAYVVFGRRGQPCLADFDGDGALTIFDFLLFQDVFHAGDLRADFDGDGALTIFDFLLYQTMFEAGCR